MHIRAKKFFTTGSVTVHRIAGEAYGLKRYETLILLSLLVLASLLRSLAYLYTVDIPGDGPARAIMACDWSKSPHISTHGNWLPGFMYLAGIFCFLVDDPLFSSRVLNLTIGTLTVPLFYLLVRRLYGRTIAFFSALILAFFPLHIGLSASSLIETSLLAEVIAAMVLLIRASEDTQNEKLCLSLGLLCLCLAVMTRYEVWLLIPLFPAYYVRKTGKFSTGILMLVILLIFPGAWMVGNYLSAGDFLPAFSSTTKMGPMAIGAQPVDIFEGIKIIGRKFVSHLGWIVSIAIGLGVLLESVQILKRKLDSERILYSLTAGIFWGFMLYFSVVRGNSLFDRFLLLGITLVVPFAGLPFLPYANGRGRWLPLIICVVIASIGFSAFSYRPDVYVTPKQPREIQKLADWLKNSPYRNDAILTTKMGWQSSYLPLYFHDLSGRSLIVSVWTKESTLQVFVRDQQPSLLVTRDGDEEFQSRLEDLLGMSIHAERLIHREGAIKVYLLKP